MDDSIGKKTSGILLGSYYGVEREILVCFAKAGYEIYHASTLEEAKLYFDTGDYDFILCFEQFNECSTLDFIRSLGKEKFNHVIALVDNNQAGIYSEPVLPKISHSLYVRTNPAIIQYVVDQLFGINRLKVEVCSN